jgi:hypothetical protein
MHSEKNGKYRNRLFLHVYVWLFANFAVKAGSAGMRAQGNQKGQRMLFFNA